MRLRRGESLMSTRFHLALSWSATAIAVVALAVSLTHHGPRGEHGLQGPQGPQGNTGRNATVAHLGVCEQDGYTWMINLGNYAPGQGSYDPPLITAPVLTSGVPSCPV